MRWKGMRKSSNVEDRRGMRKGTKAGGGIVGLLIMGALIYFMGGNPLSVLTQGGGSGGGLGSVLQGGGGQARQSTPEEDRLAEFVSVVLADTERVWGEIFRENGQTYRAPNLVIFTDQVRSACGMGSAASGPFYCPADQKAYIDLGFYKMLEQRFDAPGDFAQAYVIAHEVGHHVQNLLGISDQVHAMKDRVSEAEYNDLSVRLELQADFFAGVWAHHGDKAHNFLEAGDVKEALRAAAAIGDDRLQMQAQGYVVPDSFTHGTSEQRARWFRKGLQTGDINQGDTFKARDL